MSDWIGDENWWDPILLSACREQVQTEHYDDAILRAFRYIEDRIRELANIDVSDKSGYGTGLVNWAFHEKRTDFALRLQRREVELQSARFFVNGAFGLFRNDPAHQLIKIEYDRETCVAVLRTANLILGVVDKGQATTDDLWYEVQNPESVIAPDAALRNLLDEDPTILRDLFEMRGQSVKHERQLVVDLVDNTLPSYFNALRRKQKGHHLTALRKSLLQMLADNESPYVRQGAAFHLQFFPDDSVRESLCRILSEADEALAVVVIDTLAALGGSISRTAIIDLLNQTTYPGVRSAAIEALGNIEYAPDIIGALLGVFDKLRWWDKQRAIKCLRELETRDSEAVSALLVRCLDEESWDVQIEACITLGEFAEPNAVQSLGTLLLRTMDDDVRLAAARALKSIRNDASLTCLQESLTELKEDRPDTYRELLEQLERPASGRR